MQPFTLPFELQSALQAAFLALTFCLSAMFVLKTLIFGKSKKEFKAERELRPALVIPAEEIDGPSEIFGDVVIVSLEYPSFMFPVAAAGSSITDDNPIDGVLFTKEKFGALRQTLKKTLNVRPFMPLNS